MFNFGFWKRNGGLCKDSIEAQYNSVISADGLSYKDKYGEDREYHKAGSIKPDTTVFFDGDIQSTDTITCSGTAVPEVDDGYFYFSTAGSAWDIKITRAGTLIAWYPCVDGSGTTLANVLSDDGGGGVTAVNAPADLWQLNQDGTGSNYLNEFGYTKDSNKNQPASQSSPRLDWLGNPLQYQGQAGTPLEIVKAPVFVGDGVAYGTFANTIILSGDFVITYKCTVTTTARTTIVASDTNNAFHVYNTSSCSIKIGGTFKFMFLSRALVVGETYTFILARVLDQCSLYVNDVLQTTVTVPTVDFPITHFGVTAGVQVNSYVSKFLSLCGYTYSFTEGTPTKPSDITYDRSGESNHISWINSAAANWALKERESYPFTSGFTYNGTNRIPSLLSDKTKDATGADIRYTDKQTMNADNPMVVSLAPSQPVIESENSSGDRLFTDGSGNMTELTFSDFSANFHDTVFYSSPDKLAIYTEPITGPCLLKTEKYMG